MLDCRGCDLALGKQKETKRRFRAKVFNSTKNYTHTHIATALLQFSMLCVLDSSAAVAPSATEEVQLAQLRYSNFNDNADDDDDDEKVY